MNIEKILNDMDSEGMKEVVRTIHTIVTRVQEKQIDLDNGHFELMGCKHIIQSFALSLAREQFKKNAFVLTSSHRENGTGRQINPMTPHKRILVKR